MSNKDRRRAIRSSWGNSTYYNDYPAKFIFLLGVDKTMGKETSVKYLKEEEQFDDIILGDFHDSFHNLTYKGKFFCHFESMEMLILYRIKL